MLSSAHPKDGAADTNPTLLGGSGYDTLDWVFSSVKQKGKQCLTPEWVPTSEIFLDFTPSRRFFSIKKTYFSYYMRNSLARKHLPGFFTTKTKDRPKLQWLNKDMKRHARELKILEHIQTFFRRRFHKVNSKSYRLLSSALISHWQNYVRKIT